DHTEIQVGQQKIPLEIDYTTPLAYCMQSDARIHRMATIGLLRPDKLLEKNSDGTREIKGIYMSQPYHSQKMPVILVHGLWSSPITWMEMYNTLNSIPEIRENYQVWFYFYPNGQPFWVSAAQFRQDIALLRQELDPRRENTQLDRLTLVGHSMGGLISLLQTMNTEEKIWNLVCSVPASQTSGDQTARKAIQEWFHFQANPSIECVITLGTPFRGSAMANSATLGLTEFLGKKATDVEKNIQIFQQAN
ncbi:MAG: alpha/beta hydrolase, partial [Planctomycetia bacterium]|nr:alpha/beta hydrolase [Planctomycetia bacterium]